jgi:hypothetical protein
MANWDPSTVSPTLATAPTALGGAGGNFAGGGGVQAHHGTIGLVLFAVLILFLLDRAGFRFAVTVGRR